MSVIPTKLSFTILFCILAGCSGGSDISNNSAEEQPDNSQEDSGTDNDGNVSDGTSGSGEDDSGQVNGDCLLDEAEETLLRLVNEARAESRICGNQSYPATESVSWNCTLELAAQNHSEDMASNNFFSHTGSDGLSVSNRVSNVDYNWSAVGENIAAGYSTAESVIAGWLDSPGHCANIMNNSFTEMGISLVTTNNADFTSYWTQVLASPR